jgi:hypothetical protein
MFQEKILSFDIGIKNMAFCLFSLNSYDSEYNQHPFEINEWVVLNLMDETKEITEKCNYSINSKSINSKSKKSKNEKDKKQKESILKLDNSMNYVLDNQKTQENLCGKMAKYKKLSKNNGELFFCEKCAKKQKEYLFPKKSFQITSLKKLKIEDLEKLWQEFSISSNTNTLRETKKTKKSMIESLSEYFQNNCLEPLVEPKKIAAGDTDLITIGRNMVRLLDQVPNIGQVSMILIENQISTIATRMKSIQGMLAQYFIIRNPDAKIEFISSSNKLRQFQIDGKRTVLDNEEKQEKEKQEKESYKKHKTDGVEITREILEKNSWLNERLSILSESKKKDDLADAFLQGIWYLRKSERIKMDELIITR